MAHEMIRQKYNVETDITDWPIGLPEDQREVLLVFVAEALARFGEKGAHLTVIERMVDTMAEWRDGLPIFRTAAAWDFRYACVERALRAIDAEQRWHAKAP